MEIKRPTEAQIKELWEWCGLKVKKTENYYHDPITVLLEPPYFNSLMVDEPILDLNNLFKYAVPKLVERLGVIKARRILKDWIRYARMSLPTADDLFWAIWEVVHQS